MTLLRSSIASAIVLLAVLPRCGLIDKLKGKGTDAGDFDAAPVDAAVAVEVPDAAPAADAAVALTPTASPPIIGACKAGDLADCTNKCQVLKNQSSCVNLGIMFQNGDSGAVRDTGKDTTLFQGACNAGIGAGCERFGIALKNGSGIVADTPRALDTLKKGCDLRNAASCNEFALMNVRGEGGPKDTVKAVTFFNKSCDLGDAFGCGNLANHLASGDGIARDPARAAALRTTACNKGDQQACRALNASDAGVAVTPSATAASSANPTAADCVVLKKIFMDTCQNSCAAKLKEKKIKNTDAERLLFCEGGCSSQMFNSPTMAKCKGK